MTITILRRSLSDGQTHVWCQFNDMHDTPTSPTKPLHTIKPCHKSFLFRQEKMGISKAVFKNCTQFALFKCTLLQTRLWESSSLRDTDRNKQHQNAKQLSRGKITPSYFSSFQSYKSPEKSCITPNESRGDGTGKSKSGKRLDCGTHKFTSCTIASVRNLRCLDSKAQTQMQLVRMV